MTLFFYVINLPFYLKPKSSVTKKTNKIHF